MLSLKEIEREALQVAKGHFGAPHVKRVLVKSDVDSEGKDSLSITIVLDGIGLFTGARLSGLSLDLINFMTSHNDDRYPYTRYATERELKALAEEK